MVACSAGSRQAAWRLTNSRAQASQLDTGVGILTRSVAPQRRHSNPSVPSCTITQSGRFGLAVKTEGHPRRDRTSAAAFRIHRESASASHPSVLACAARGPSACARRSGPLPSLRSFGRVGSAAELVSWLEAACAYPSFGLLCLVFHVMRESRARRLQIIESPEFLHAPAVRPDNPPTVVGQRRQLEAILGFM